MAILPTLLAVIPLPGASHPPAPTPVLRHLCTYTCAEDPADVLDAIIDDYTEAYNEFMSAYRAAEASERDQIVKDMLPDAEEYAQMILKLIADHEGEDVAWDGLSWITSRASRSASAPKALMMMLTQFPEKKELGDTVMRATRGPFSLEVVEAMQAVMKSTPHPTVKGNTCFALGMQFKGLADKADNDKQRDAYNAQYLKHMQRVCEEFGDIPYRKRTLKAAAEGELFVAQNLQIGMMAPDIEGDDLDGVSFKLSDYRGKVVVLDFWGNW